MTSKIATVGTRSTKASKALDTMRARIVKADAARRDGRAGRDREAAEVLHLPIVDVEQVSSGTRKRRPRACHADTPARARSTPSRRSTAIATVQRWPNARAAGGRARYGSMVCSIRPSRLSPVGSGYRPCASPLRSRAVTRPGRIDHGPLAALKRRWPFIHLSVRLHVLHSAIDKMATLAR